MGSSASKGKLAQTPPVRSPSPPNFCPSPATPKDTDYRSAGGDAGDPLPTQQADIIGTVSMSSSGGVQVDVPVTVDDISMRGCAEVLQAPMFLDWVKTCEADPKLFINRIHVQSVDMFGSRVGFVKLRSEAYAITGSGDKVDVPGIVFMRGGSVSVLIVLECEGMEYTILTRQPRVPAADHNLPEIPAGTLDGSGNFRGVAAEEIEEECDIVIEESELVDMTELAHGDRWRGMVPSGGGCDEFIRLYLLRRSVERDVLEELEGRLTGMAQQGEHITLQVLPLEGVWKHTPDAKCLVALTLYRALQEDGKLGAASAFISQNDTDEEEGGQQVVGVGGDDDAGSGGPVLEGMDSDGEDSLDIDLGDFVHTKDEMLVDRSTASPNSGGNASPTAAAAAGRLRTRSEKGRLVALSDLKAEAMAWSTDSHNSAIINHHGASDGGGGPSSPTPSDTSPQAQAQTLLANLQARLRANEQEHEELLQAIEAAQQASHEGVTVITRGLLPDGRGSTETA